MKSVILAAGMSTRMSPLNLEIHKALLPIKGEPIIEKMIKYLHSNDVTDITIVVGYMADSFEYLKEKYNVELRLSDKYKTHNNYTSIQLVLDKFDDCLVLEADLYIIDDFIPSIDKLKNQYFSQEITYGLEWELILDDNDKIVQVESNRTSGWGLIGISYWKGDMTEALEKELAKCSPNQYWDDAVWNLLGKYDVYANKCQNQIVQELDKIEDIVHYNLMSHDEIMSLCLKSDKFKKIDDDTYILGDKKLIFRDDKIIVE